MTIELKKTSSIADRLTPETTYADLYGSADGLTATIGGVSYPNLNQAFNQPVEVSAKSLELLGKAEERLSKLVDSVNKRRNDLDARIQKNALRSLSAQPGGKEEIKLAALMRDTNSLRILNNPLSVPSSVRKTRDDKGLSLIVRFGGSVLGQLLPGETVEGGQARLEALVAKDQILSAFKAAANINDARADAIGFSVRPMPTSDPASVGVAVAVGIRLDSVRQLEALNKRLASLEEPVKLLNPLHTDNTTLQLNASEEDQIRDLADELEGPQDEPDTTAAAQDFQDAV